MKKFSLCFILLLSNFLFAQNDYTKYFKNCFDAEYQVYLKNNSVAWKIYNTTFENYFPQIASLNKAISLGEEMIIEEPYVIDDLNRLKNFKEVFFGDNAFLRLNINPEVKEELIKTYHYLNEIDFKPITDADFVVVQKLSSFLYLDQSTRKIDRNNTNKDSIIYEMDKIIYNDFLVFIRTYGYPSQRKYGMYSIYPHFLILHCTANFGITKEIEQLLLNEIKKGNYHPSAYARIVDRYNTWILKKPQVYGEWISDGVIGEIDDIKNIDKRRSELGLEPLYEFCKKNGLALPKNYLVPKIYKN
jgi:hypothetical protein